MPIKEHYHLYFIYFSCWVAETSAYRKCTNAYYDFICIYYIYIVFFSVAYNNRMRQFVILDSKGITTWKRDQVDPRGKYSETFWDCDHEEYY